MPPKRGFWFIRWSPEAEVVVVVVVGFSRTGDGHIPRQGATFARSRFIALQGESRASAGLNFYSSKARTLSLSLTLSHCRSLPEIRPLKGRPLISQNPIPDFPGFRIPPPDCAFAFCKSHLTRIRGSDRENRGVGFPANCGCHPGCHPSLTLASLFRFSVAPFDLTATRGCGGPLHLSKWCFFPVIRSIY